MTKEDAIEALRAHFSEDTVWNLVEALVKAEREQCTTRASVALLGTLQTTTYRVLKAIRRGQQ